MRISIQSKFFVYLLALVGVAGLSLPATGYAKEVATLQAPQGEVFVHKSTAAAEEWLPVTQTIPLENGDSVKTAAGTCVVMYTDQATFAVQTNTRLTIDEKTDTQDIHLDLGALKAKIDKIKTVKPFQVVTPTAVASVRGTEVDFAFDDQGQLTVDLHKDGPVQVSSDETGMELELTDGNKITVKYDAEKGEITVSNSCDSTGAISFSINGQDYEVDKCETTTVSVNDTAAGGPNEIGTGQDNEGDEPVVDEGDDDDDSDDDTPPPSSVFSPGSET